jgi:hypothetical protein
METGAFEPLGGQVDAPDLIAPVQQPETLQIEGNSAGNAG